MSGSASVWSEVLSGPDVPGEAAVRPEVTLSRDLAISVIWLQVADSESIVVAAFVFSTAGHTGRKLVSASCADQSSLLERAT